MSPEVLPILFAVAALAGWVDAIVGGGGLLQLPAMLIAGSSLPVPTVLGTAKLSSAAGTLCATVTYARKHPINRAVALQGGITAVIGAAGGALLASTVSSAFLRPFILVLLIAVAVFVLLKPDFGTRKPKTVTVPDGDTLVRVKVETRRRRGTAALVVVAGGLIGVYDGMVGPGTGTFLVIAVTTLLGLEFISALATVKLINLGTNVGALAVFAVQGHVLWLLGAGMAVFNIIGAVVGARMTLSRGSKFVRAVLLVVVTCMVARLALDQFGVSLW